MTLFNMNFRIILESKEPEDYNQRFAVERGQKTLCTEKRTTLHPDLQCWRRDSPSGGPTGPPVPTKGRKQWKDTYPHCPIFITSGKDWNL